MENITKIDIMNLMSIATLLVCMIGSIICLCKYPFQASKRIIYGGLWVNKKQSENCPAIPVDKIEMIAINDLGDGLYVTQ